jgi:hypothetical protein
MLALSDELVAIIRRYAAPIPPPARCQFYEQVDQELLEADELGPGVVARTCRKVRRRLTEGARRAASR